MKHYKKIFILFLFIILSPINTKALMCSNADKVKYQTMAQNIKSSYDYVDNGGIITFNVTLSNIPERFIISSVALNQRYEYTSSELIINNLNPGQSYRFDVYINDDSCYLERLYSVYVNLPFYNLYYDDEICDGIESFKYCNKWQSNSLTYDEFAIKVAEYKLSLQDELILEEETYDGVFDKIIDFYVKYYYIILPSIIILCIGYMLYRKYK
ncbi:MAG: hypothetical protein PHN42_01580 [Bacilli bacterium]|nr:hypothetical protein [Bacilli bacterium]